MAKNFTQNIRPAVEQEIALANAAALAEDYQLAFRHLERAHVLGQESTALHVRVHYLMLCWALRKAASKQSEISRDLKEVFGQLFRIAGAATKTAFGLVPTGNTGGANISPFKVLPISADLAAQITQAKQ